MKIYLLKQDIDTDYDTYGSAVVIAENEDEARKIHPSEYVTHFKNNKWMGTYTDGEEYEIEDSFGWVLPSEIKEIEVIYLGEAEPSQKKGLIIASLNKESE